MATDILYIYTLYVYLFDLFRQFFETLNLMSLSGRWGDSINHGVWKPWLRAIKWTQKIEQKPSSKFARVQVPMRFLC